MHSSFAQVLLLSFFVSIASSVDVTCQTLTQTSGANGKFVICDKTTFVPAPAHTTTATLATHSTAVDPRKPDSTKTYPTNNTPIKSPPTGNSPTHKSPTIKSPTTGFATHKQTNTHTTTTKAHTPILFPVTTKVTKPTANKSHGVIPCDLWFFSLCLPSIQLLGWQIDLPPGIYPPGPPPPIETGNDHMKISIKGTLPKWPKYTIGQNHVPTFSPTAKPDDCTPETAELCVTTTLFKTSVSKQVTKTTSTQTMSTCATVTGCNLKDSATTTTKTTGVCVTETANPSCIAQTYTFVVYPSDPTNTATADAIETELQEYVKDANDLYSSRKTWKDLVYWTLPLTEANVTTLRNSHNIASVIAVCDSICSGPGACIPCPDPSLGIEYQPPLAYKGEEHTQVGFISWPQGQTTYTDYYFDDSGGESSKFYILDSGANLDHPEFQNTNLWNKNDLKWIWVSDDINGGRPKDDANTPINPNVEGHNAHGTAMLGAVAGNLLGVAKRVKPVLVRMPRKAPDGGNWNYQDWLQGLAAINEDLGAMSGQSISAIVLMAQCWEERAFVRRTPGTGDLERDVNGHEIFDTFGPTIAMRQQLQLLQAKGVLLITGGGNNPFSPDIIGWPQSFAFENPPLESLLLAGAISLDGTQTKYPQSPQHGIPQVFAPGLDVLAAQGQPALLAKGLATNKYKTASGTSYSAAYTAGLAAYFWELLRLHRLPSGPTLGPTAVDLKDYITNLAWVRKPITNARITNPKSIWNGITHEEQDGVCEWQPDAPAQLRRDTGGGACPSPTKSSPTSPSPKSPSPTKTSTKKTSTKKTSTKKTSTKKTSTKLPSPTPTSPKPPPPNASGFNGPSTDLVRECLKPSNFKRHGDIDSGTQASYANSFCEAAAHAGSTVANTTVENLPQGFNEVYSFYQINYQYRIRWHDGCDSGTSHQNASLPLGGDYPGCAQIFIDNYQKCNNGGIGGATLAGCLEYTFIGGGAGDVLCDGCVGLPPP